LAKSAVDAIGPAFEHTKKQLFEPFRFGQWARLAVLALATGEMASGGGCNGSWKSLASIPSRWPSPSQNFIDPKDLWQGLDPALLIAMAIVAVVGFSVLALVWMYVASVSRFVLFEAVLHKHAELGESWQRWQRPGLGYFGWKLAISILGLGVAGALLFPLLLAVLAAVKNHQQPGPGLLLAFLPLLLVFFVFGMFMLLIAVLGKDFVVPLMAVDNVGVIEGWRRLLGMIKAESWGYAGYLGMKIVLAIGASVLFGILSTVAAMFIVIPGAVLVVIGYLLGRGTGFSWNAGTLTLAIVVGVLALSLLLYGIALVCVPVAVFFPAYAMYFFAERFPALHALLYPPPPLAAAPPPLSPAAGPIG
jgi:hypothetical protein